MTSKNQHSPSFYASVTDAAKIEKIVDYSFEKNEKSNVLAIHQTRPLIAYLINIQRTQKISKAWTSGTEPSHSPSSSTINGQNNADKAKTVSIRVIDYVTRQRCLAKGIYHARPADCVFTINSLICSQADIIKLAVVDRLANIYLYDLSYFINDLTATRIAVIRGPGQDVSPYESINLVWCPFVPCEDFDDGDGGLRLALATNSRIEIFAIDRLQGKTGELQRSDLKGSYKCINDAHRSNIVSLSISPDCSTISAAALDNRVTFFSSDIDDVGQRCLHNWDANIKDRSSISRLFFLDEYPKLLEDNTMKFWGSAFIGTRSGQMLLVDLRTWTVYQKMNINVELTVSKNFDYRIDLTSRNIIAINGNQCYIVQIEHDNAKLSSSSTGSTMGGNHNETNLMDTGSSDLMNGNMLNYLSSSKHGANSRSAQKSGTKKQSRASSVSNDIGTFNGLPKIVRITRLGLHNPIYSFVIKHKSDDELEMFTITAFSLERYIINLNTISRECVEDLENLQEDSKSNNANTPHELKRFLQQFDGSMRISSSGSVPNNTLITSDLNTIDTSVNITTSPVKREVDLLQLMNTSINLQNQNQDHNQAPKIPIQPSKVMNVEMNNEKPITIAAPVDKSVATGVDVNQMDRIVEALFTKLNAAFSQGLDEFLNDVKCEVNDLKLKLNSLGRDVRRLQQQLQEARQK